MRRSVEVSSRWPKCHFRIGNIRDLLRHTLIEHSAYGIMLAALK